MTHAKHKRVLSRTSSRLRLSSSRRLFSSLRRSSLLRSSSAARSSGVMSARLTCGRGETTLLPRALVAAAAAELVVWPPIALPLREPAGEMGFGAGEAEGPRGEITLGDELAVLLVAREEIDRPGETGLPGPLPRPPAAALAAAAPAPPAIRAAARCLASSARRFASSARRTAAASIALSSSSARLQTY
jgi:hypothetical protein